MTKEERREIYLAAMLEVVANNELIFISLDKVLGRTAKREEFPELCYGLQAANPMCRLSDAIDRCE